MKKYLFMAISALAAVALVSCNKDDEVKKNTTKDYGDVAKVCINEVCGVTGYKGVELFNADTKVVSLEGVGLFKNDAAEATWTGTESDEIPAGGYFVIKSKKETGQIDAVANAKAADSFSPGQTLKLVLKKGSTELSSFIRGVEPWSTVIEAVTWSFGRTTDGGSQWKFLDITIGATNNNAAQHGDITANPAASE